MASYALGLASVLLLFASILAHEFGHALVARRRGIEVQEIDLWLLGGVSRMRGEAHAPATSWPSRSPARPSRRCSPPASAPPSCCCPSSTPAVVRALIDYQALVNCLMLVFNLMPAFPLDGGRVLRSLLWRRSGDIGRSTETAASVGRGFGYLLICLGGLEFLSGVPEGLWLALIGFFIVSAASAEVRGAQVRAVLSGVHVRELMSSPVVSVPADVPAAQAASDFFLARRYTSFPVVDERGRALGLVSLAQIEALTPEQRERRRVGEIAERDPSLLVGEADDVAGLLELPAFARVGRAVAVDARGRPVGLLSITDVQRSLRASLRATGPPVGARPRQAAAGPPPSADPREHPSSAQVADSACSGVIRVTLHAG